ncbi:MAG: hypothetical protein Q9225_007827 [Loekoesia sp. 1 TL-2023]
MNNPFIDIAVVTALLLHISTSTALAVNALRAFGPPRCWKPRVSPHTLVFRECNDVITKQIIQTPGFDPLNPLTFSRNPALRPDIRLPKAWEHETGDCIVVVDIPATRGGSEKTSLQDIRSAAQSIAVECVIKPDHLGGALRIGWQNNLNVLILSNKGPPQIMGGTEVNSTVDEVAYE